MDFELTFTAEQETFRQTIQEWLQENIPDEMEAPADPGQLTATGYQKQRELGRKLGEIGWLYPTFPKEYGGGGFSSEEALILDMEMEQYGLTLPPYYDSGGKLGAASILVWGSEDQKQYFLPKILKGQIRTWQLLTEPEAGSDLAGVRSTAIKEGDSYIINGQKIFVGSTHGADYSWMIVNTDPQGKRHENLSWFMVPMDLPGITVSEMDILFAGGERGAASGAKQTVYLDNVRLPAFNLVGGENNGWKVAGTHLELEHGLMQSANAGQEFLNRIFRLCESQIRSGSRTKNDSEIKDFLADLYIDMQIGRLLNLRNFWIRATNRTLTYEGPQSYLHTKRSALRAAKLVQKMFGPQALIKDNLWALDEGHIEAQQRGAIVAQHPGGTVEIQKVIMARRLGIGRTTKEKAGVLR